MHSIMDSIHKVKDVVRLPLPHAFHLTLLREKETKDTWNKTLAHLLADGVDVGSRDLVWSGHIYTSVKDN